MADDADARAREIIAAHIAGDSATLRDEDAAMLADAILSDLKAAGLVVVPNDGYRNPYDGQLDLGRLDLSANITPELRKAYEFYLANRSEGAPETEGKG